MPEAFGQNEQVESQEAKSESVADISLKANKQADSLTKESEKLGVDVDKPRNPEEVFEYKSAQEAQPDLDFLEKGREVSGKEVAKLAGALTQIDPDSIVSEKTDLSPEELKAGEENIKDLTVRLEEHPEDGYETLLGLKPSLM